MIADDHHDDASRNAANCPATTRPSAPNRSGDNIGLPVRLIPVVRNKRAMWRIPRLNQQGLRQAQLDEVGRLEQAFRGTTFAGRELFRKILFGIEKRLMRPGTKTEEVIAYARCELSSFPSL